MTNEWSEGDWLTDQMDDGWSPYQAEQERIANEIAKMRRLKVYEVTKAAKVGTLCKCAACGKEFTKKSYQQAFCSNKGRGNCKDKFWNRANDDRSHRASFFASQR